MSSQICLDDMSAAKSFLSLLRLRNKEYRSIWYESWELQLMVPEVASGLGSSLRAASVREQTSDMDGMESSSHVGVTESHEW